MSYEEMRHFQAQPLEVPTHHCPLRFLLLLWEPKNEDGGVTEEKEAGQPLLRRQLLAS